MSARSDQDYTDFVSARLPALHRLAHHLCGTAHQADDLVQDTITKLYVRWPIRDVDNLDAYLRTMLVRTFIDERRRGWWRVRLFGGTTLEPPPTAAEAAGAEDRTVLRSLLATLPPRQQAVLVLRFLHDLPITDVATMMGCSAGTVKSQTARALATMRKLLGDRPADTDAGQTTTGALR